MYQKQDPESDALEQLYRTYAIPVQRYVLSLCGNVTLADDITAETFYKAIQHIDDFNGGRIFTWLCAIARNSWLDIAKSKEHANLPITEELEVSLPDIAHTPEDSYIAKDERLELYRQMQNLQGEAKDVVYLRIFAQLSFKEIGDVLNKSENWTRVTFYRSKEKLKGWMNYEV